MLELTASCYSAADLPENLRSQIVISSLKTSFPYGKDSDGCRKKS